MYGLHRPGLFGVFAQIAVWFPRNADSGGYEIDMWKTLVASAALSRFPTLAIASPAAFSEPFRSARGFPPGAHDHHYHHHHHHHHPPGAPQ